jgi:endonuclease/exonuclease/phosphatase (EEP) superfamily protein YafD
VVLRFVAWDLTEQLAILNAQTVWVFLPVYAIASAAWCFRRFLLAGIATAVVGFHVLVVATSIGSVAPIPADLRDGPRLRVLSANVRYTNPEPEALARELLAADADVVLLQEITPRWIEVLTAAGFDERYAHAARATRRDAGGQAVYSRLPLRDVQVTEHAFWPMINATVVVEGRYIALVDVHTAGPPEGMDRHNATTDGVLAVTRRLPGPRVVAGDFNASPYNRTIARVMDLGLDSAHERRGRGLAATWPNGKRIWTPIRLDHVFVDEDVAVFDVRELEGTGSDHKPVLVELGFR